MNIIINKIKKGLKNFINTGIKLSNSQYFKVLLNISEKLVKN